MIGRLAVRTTALALVLNTAGCALLSSSTAERSPAESDIAGHVRRVMTTEDDTLIDLARTHDLGYIELVVANPGVDPWVPGRAEIILPTAHVLPPGPREGIVINLAEQRLFLFGEGRLPMTFPIGVGREGARTPQGRTTVVRKRAKPIWYPGPSARAEDPTLGRAVGPGPDNPLGTHAIYLGWPAYLIHGTNKPYGIGRRVSRGCIRLYPEDIVQLFPLVQVGTPVRVINEPVKLGWRDGELYMEVHPTLEQASEIQVTGGFQQQVAPDLTAEITARAGDEAARLDWKPIRDALERRHGIPVRVTRPVHEPFAPLRRFLRRVFSIPEPPPVYAGRAREWLALHQCRAGCLS